MMRSVMLVPVLLSIAACASQMPTFDEATEIAAAHSTEPSLKEWMEGEFSAFWERNFKTIVPPCVQLIPDSASVAVRLVVDSHSSPLRVSDDSPTPFSTCVSARMQALAWPAAPEDLRYLPITLNAHRPDSGADAVEDVIIDVTPSDKSQKRTRDE